MESNFFQGDLADIFRPGSVNSGGDPPPGVSADWQYFDDRETQKSTRRIMNHDNDEDDDHLQEGFGQPLFTSLLSDPLTIHHELEAGTTSAASTPSCFFNHRHQHHLEQQQSSASRLLSPSLGFDDHNMINHNQNHNNIFSKMLQISPNNAAKSTTTSNCTTSETIMTSASSNSSSSKRCLLETSTTTSLQISSPRNPAIKRIRKSQAKKVVCIPAPTPANSRPTGEVVPSDLWAWRKYGQKPIKGSPYPRGYYRCSSSKGCSARKQVERSRTDPNMLVITYTSEHNHPWPTQRNALAGSTRSTPQTTPKTAAEQPPSHHQQKQQNTQEEEDDDHHHQGSAGTGGVAQVKDELLQEALIKEEEGIISTFPHHHHHQGGYRPEFPHERGGNGGGQPDHDFFSGLGEIEVDPISMLLNQDFLGADDQDQPRTHYNKDDLDPFC